MLQRIDGYESFFGAIPYKMLQSNAKNKVENDKKTEEHHTEKESMSLSYIIPNDINQNDAMLHLNLITQKQLKYHKKWFYLNISILPFTALMSLLPGPNIFVLYNGFRSYSHYKAYHGAIGIQQRQSEFNIVYDGCLDEIYHDIQDDENDKTEINDDDLHELQEKFDCQHLYHHLHRARYQVVDLQRHSRYQLLRAWHNWSERRPRLQTFCKWLNE